MPNCKWDGKPFEPDPRAVRYDENGAPVPPATYSPNPGRSRRPGDNRVRQWPMSEVSTKEFCSTACRQAFYRFIANLTRAYLTGDDDA
jgi:hypothetical protein